MSLIAQTSRTWPPPWIFMDVDEDTAQVRIIRAHVPHYMWAEIRGTTTIRTAAGPLRVVSITEGYIGEDFVYNAKSFELQTEVDPDGSRPLGEAYAAPEAAEEELPRGPPVVTQIVTRIGFSAEPASASLRQITRGIELVVAEQELIRIRCDLHDMLKEWYSTPEWGRSSCDRTPAYDLAKLLEGG